MNNLKKLPVYYLEVDDTEESGVRFVSLVDEPATGQNWLAFSNEELNFRISDNEQRVISGPLMLADTPIFRVDKTRGEHYVIFTKELIRKMVLKFFRENNINNLNLLHNENQKADGIILCESFFIDTKRGLNPPIGFEKIPEGSWFGSYKVENEEIWENYILSGKLKGFSIEGLFSYPALNKDESMLQKIMEVV